MTTNDPSCLQLRLALGAYVVGALPAEEAARLEAHLHACPDCAAERDLLAALPPRLATVDPAEVDRGRVQAGPEMLDRLLDRVTAERKARQRRRLLAAAAAVVLLLGGGVWAFTAGTGGEGGNPAPTVAAPTDGVGTHEAKDDETGAWAQVRTRAVAAGTKVSLQLSGVPEGENCRLVAVTPDGRREVAASWKATYEGTANIEGSVALAAARISKFEVMSFGGARLVSVRVCPGPEDEPCDLK